MSIYQTPSNDTLKALETAPNMYLVLSPELNILTASDLYLQATKHNRETIVGKHIFEAFPANPNLPDGDGVQNINASLQMVLRTKKPHFMNIQRYDVPDANDPGKFVQHYWDPSHTPVLDECGNISYIIQQATDVTAKITTEQALSQSQGQQEETVRQVQSLNEELSSMNEILRRSQDRLQQLNDQQDVQISHSTNELRLSEKRYRSLVEQSPIAQQVFRGDDMTFELVNEAMLQFLGKDASIIGKPLFVGVPEIVGQPIVEFLYQVYRTGERMELKAIETTLLRNGKYETGYYDVSYRALYDGDHITGVLGIAIDVTEQVNTRKEVAEMNERLNIAIDAGGLGYTEVDLAAGTMASNDAFKNCYGRAAEDTFTYAQLYDSMLPEYREQIRQQVSKAQAEHSLYQATYQVRWPDSSVHWISAHGRARYNSEGEADRMVVIVSDITEQKKDDQRKSDFIGMVSHELKTPLTSMKGYIQMLQVKARQSDDSFTNNVLDKANRQVQKMTTMINGFLNVSRLESGKIHIHKEVFDIAELIDEMKEESAATISSHQLKFLPMVETMVMADREKIGHVINNFISNAVKYSANGTTIEMSCEAKNGEAVFSVKDEGTGISPADVKQLFERYFRVENHSMTSISGFGIGLYLCSEIIQRHDGKIGVESELVKGSTFWFALPLAN